MSWLKGAIDDEQQALEQLLEMGRQKLVEAGRELLTQAESTVDGMTITCTFTATISKKKDT
jgi:hypothetical protein